MKTLQSEPFECIVGNWPPRDSVPDLLFIHGAGLSKRLWEAQIEDLKDISNPVALDLPGHGNSAGPGKDSIAAYADDVLHFIREAGLSQSNLVLCGMSMGGAVVQQLLIAHPERFKAGILVNTGARLKVLPVIFETVNTDFEGLIRNIPAMSLSPATDRSQFEEQILDFSSQCDARTAIQDFTACNAFDVMAQIPSITCPVLVLSAEHDLSTPPKYGLWLKQNLKNAEHVHVDNAGHFSMIEKADVVNTAIRKFLEVLS